MKENIKLAQRERGGGEQLTTKSKNLHVQECVISSRFVIFNKIFHFCYFLCVLSLLISFMLLFCVRYVLIIFILTTVSASMNASAVKNLLRTPMLSLTTLYETKAQS